jgi:hypothetical protein
LHHRRGAFYDPNADEDGPQPVDAQQPFITALFAVVSAIAFATVLGTVTSPRLGRLFMT